jgi:galactose mutarotase-like enzyme
MNPGDGLSESSVERVILKTDTFQVTVLPALGGKIASMVALRQNVELMQQPLAPYGPRTMSMGFEESDASGFDECLPSVAACEVETAAGRRAIPDHGEFWRLPHTWELNGQRLRLSAKGESLPLRLDRVLHAEGNALTIDYSVRNEGDFPVEYAWSAHPLFVVDTGDRVVLPASVSEIRVEGSGGGRLGAKGTVHPWPRTKSSTGEAVDLSVAGSITDETGDKVYAASPAEGWAALERKQHGLRIDIRYDASKLSSLGLWLCYGGWPEGAENRQYCVAIEPCTAPDDSLAAAIEKGWAKKLAPGQSNDWRMRIEIRDVMLHSSL